MLRGQVRAVQGHQAKSGRIGTHTQMLALKRAWPNSHTTLTGLQRKGPGLEAGSGDLWTLGGAKGKAWTLGRDWAVRQPVGGASQKARLAPPAAGASFPGRGCGADRACPPPPNCQCPPKGREKSYARHQVTGREMLLVRPAVPPSLVSHLHAGTKAPTKCKDRLGTRGRR